MDMFADGQEVRYLPCLHLYHRSCIDGWLYRFGGLVLNLQEGLTTR